MSEDTRSRPPRANWALFMRGNNTAGLYALALIDLSQVSGKNVQGATRDINNRSLDDVAFTEFAFKVNPKSMDLEEPAAVVIVPTQDGNQFVEHQGQIYKNVVITGTTGLRPNRQANGAIIPLSGIANPFATFDPDPETGLPRGERTGFDDLIDLRNLFRRYFDLKRDPSRASTTIMVWKNGKEGEYYVVEPMTFKSSRDASAPVTHTYTMQLRTIGRLDIVQVQRKYDPYANMNGVDGFFARMSDVRRQLSAAFTLASSFIDRTATIAQSTITNVLQPVNDVLQSLTGVVTAGTRVFDIPQNALSTIATNSVSLATAIDALPNNSYVSNGVTSQLSIISHAYKTMARQLRQLANETQLFTTPLSGSVSDKWAAYTNPITGLPATGGSPTALGNLQVPNAAATYTIHDNEDIRALALRTLGDSAKWKILVLLNKLSQPYISPKGNGIDVLRPGDDVLVPRAMATAGSTVAPQEQKFAGMSTLNQRLGRDWRLVAIQGAAGIVQYDLMVASNGDFDTVEGLDNMTQAIDIKLATEQGELPTHPTFGLRFATGTKARTQALIAFDLNARATFLSDSRIDTVEQMQLAVTGNVLSVKALLTLKGQDDTLNYDFSVQR